MKTLLLVYYRPSDVHIQRQWKVPWSWIDWNYWTIKKTGGEFCHVELSIESDYIYSVNGRLGVLERQQNKSYATPDRYKFQTIEVTELQYELVRRWCAQRYMDNVKFDTWGLVSRGLGLPVCQSRDRFLCSEFVVKALQQADLLLDLKNNPKDVSPSDLYDHVQKRCKPTVEHMVRY